MVKLLQHKGSGRIYVATPELEERNDMIPHTGPNPFQTTVKATTRAKTVASTPISADEAEALATARARYEELLGKAPPKNMKLDTLQAKIAEAEAEALIKEEQVPVPDDAGGDAGEDTGSEEDLPGFGD